jgi:biopolymer transport protein ExbD
MQIEQSAPIRKPLPLTPLVDIVFLLLMFFMLTSNFTKFGNLNLGIAGVAQSGTVQTASSPTLIINVEANAGVRVNGKAVTREALSGLLNEFAAKGVSAAVVRVDARASVQDLVTALEAARQSDLQSIKVAR